MFLLHPLKCERYLLFFVLHDSDLLSDKKLFKYELQQAFFSDSLIFS